VIIKFPKFISNDEFFIRFVFKSDFKNKLRVKDDKINFSGFLLPNKGGVSLQRGLFCDENEAKFRAKLISPINYVGFYVFKKIDFNEKLKLYLKSNPNFKVNIFATPLDINSDYIALPIEFDEFEIEKGNPSHSDIIYINPSPKEGETPKVAIRSFVRKFFNQKYLIFDDNIEESKFMNCKFIDVLE